MAPGGLLGCCECCPSNPQEAWAGVARLDNVLQLVQEPHLGISLRRCRACGQGFAFVFSEQTDWVHGNDPQGGALVPLLVEEWARLAGLGASVDFGILRALTDGRRWLSMDHPSEGPKSLEWMTGTFVVLPND